MFPDRSACCAVGVVEGDRSRQRGSAHVRDVTSGGTGGPDDPAESDREIDRRRPHLADRALEPAELLAGLSRARRSRLVEPDHEPVRARDRDRRSAADGQGADRLKDVSHALDAPLADLLRETALIDDVDGVAVPADAGRRSGGRGRRHANLGAERGRAAPGGDCRRARVDEGRDPWSAYVSG